MPFPNEGHWAPLGSIGVDAMRCVSEDNCLGGAPAALPCYSTLENLTACAQKAKTENDEFGASILCAEGSKGRLCDICEQGFFYANGEGCLACSSSASITGSVVMMFIVRPTKKACIWSTMTILAPIALLGRECYAYYLFSSHGNIHCS